MGPQQHSRVSPSLSSWEPINLLAVNNCNMNEKLVSHFLFFFFGANANSMNSHSTCCWESKSQEWAEAHLVGDPPFTL